MESLGFLSGLKSKTKRARCISAKSFTEIKLLVKLPKNRKGESGPSETHLFKPTPCSFMTGTVF
jgi:hypothetical protein